MGSGPAASILRLQLCPMIYGRQRCRQLPIGHGRGTKNIPWQEPQLLWPPCFETNQQHAIAKLSLGKPGAPTVWIGTMVESLGQTPQDISTLNSIDFPAVDFWMEGGPNRSACLYRPLHCERAGAKFDHRQIQLYWPGNSSSS